MGGKSASKRAAKDARQMRRDEEARQQRVTDGTARVNDQFNGQFDDKFYSGIAESYSNFARPQLEEQRDTANSQLLFDLARGGKLDSSTRATKGADLQQTYDLGLQDIADKALGAKNDARGSVEDARSSLIAQLNATGDATGAVNAATNRIQALSRPAGNFSPIADMFAGFTDQLSSRYAQERAYAASNGMSQGYKPAAYGPSSSAVRVTG